MIAAAAILALPSLSSAPSAEVRSQAAQPAGFERALGAWRSTEQFEGEPRVSFAFRRQPGEVTGWAVLLGQHRKADNRATLALSFCGVKWNGDRVTFETILPEDEGTIGWEMRVTGDAAGILTAVTENGSPILDPPTWDVTR